MNRGGNPAPVRSTDRDTAPREGGAGGAQRLHQEPGRAPVGQAERETALQEQRPTAGPQRPPAGGGREAAGGRFHLCRRLPLRPESPRREPTLPPLVSLVKLTLFLQHLLN